MYPRTEYEITEEQLAKILDASKPTPCILIGGLGGVRSPSPQENANRAWQALGEELGFDPMTVRPIQGKGNRFFTAVPSETDGQRQEREKQEAKEAREKRITTLQEQIAENQAEIHRLQEEATA